WVGMALQLMDAMGQVPALREGRLFVADRANVTPAGCFADAALRVPEVVDPAYVDRLSEICAEHHIRVIVPHLDIDLVRLAPHRNRFDPFGTRIICPPPELVDLCGDKLRFAAFAHSEHLPYPRQYSNDSLHEGLFPLFMKRRRGSASVGAR